MITSLSINELTKYVSRQLNFFYPDNKPVRLNVYEQEMKFTLDRLEHCYSFCSQRHYNDGKNTYFNHLYSDHYVMYLWYLANEIWKRKEDRNVCNKLYYLNKSLHGLDCMFDTKLPDIFLLFHSSGTMLGKASYSNFFVALQGCTVGSHKGKYPVMDVGVSLTAHSSIIGNCNVGKNVSISAYTTIFETPVPDNSVVFRNNKGELTIKKSQTSYSQTFFKVPIK